MATHEDGDTWRKEGKWFSLFFSPVTFLAVGSLTSRSLYYLWGDAVLFVVQLTYERTFQWLSLRHTSDPQKTIPVPCKVIQDSLGFWIPSRGFRIPRTGFQIPRQWNLNSRFHSFVGFRILELYYGFQSPGFRISKVEISWIPESGFKFETGGTSKYHSVAFLSHLTTLNNYIRNIQACASCLAPHLSLQIQSPGDLSESCSVEQNSALPLKYTSIVHSQELVIFRTFKYSITPNYAIMIGYLVRGTAKSHSCYQAQIYPIV